MSQTLLLNASFEPLNVISWQRAVTLSFLGKVEVLRTYDQDIRSVSVSIRMPAVVRLVSFVRRVRTRVSFSRKNLFARDRHTCQYCGVHGPRALLTYDHVMPKSQGGKTSWTNIVTCCSDCNRKKGGRTPEQAGMELRRPPRAPKYVPGFVTVTVGRKQAPASWWDYLYFSATFGDDAG